MTVSSAIDVKVDEEPQCNDDFALLGFGIPICANKISPSLKI